MKRSLSVVVLVSLLAAGPALAQQTAPPAGLAFGYEEQLRERASLQLSAVPVGAGDELFHSPQADDDITDASISPLGHGFLASFLESWAPPPEAAHFEVTVAEIPSERNVMVAVVRLDGKVVFQVRLLPHPEFLMHAGALAAGVAADHLARVPLLTSGE